MNIKGITIVSNHNASDVIVVLGKISEVTNEYLCMRVLYGETGKKESESYPAFMATNIKSFIELGIPNTARSYSLPDPFKRFVVISELEVAKLWLDTSETVTIFNIAVGESVVFNGGKFLFLGAITNKYAQWNIPTPVLFRPNNVLNDIRSLYSSRLTEQQILDKINEKWHSLAYVDDVAIPLLDMTFQLHMNEIQAEGQFSTLKASSFFARLISQNNTIDNPVKDIFIDVVIRDMASELQTIKVNYPKAYSSVINLSDVLNKLVNKRINEGSETAVEEEVDLSFLDDIEDMMDLSFLDEDFEV